MKVLNKDLLKYGAFALCLLVPLILFPLFLSQGARSTATQNLDLGQRYLHDLQYDEAIVCFSNAIDIEPYNAEAYSGLAEAYLEKGDSMRAIQILQEAIAKVPENPLYETLVDAYIKNNQYEDADWILGQLLQKSDKPEYWEKREEIHQQIYRLPATVAVGRDYILALSENKNELSATGNNRFGQWGTMKTSTMKLPAPVSLTSIFAGDFTSYLVGTDGVVYSAGLNLVGQAANGATSILESEQWQKSSAPAGTVGIASGYHHALFLTENGEVYGAGSNSCGQLGASLKAMQLTERLPLQGKALRVYAADYYSAVLMGDYTLRTFGYLPTRENAVKSYDSVKCAGLNNEYIARIDFDNVLYLNGNRDFGGFFNDSRYLPEKDGLRLEKAVRQLVALDSGIVVLYIDGSLEFLPLQEVALALPEGSDYREIAGRGSCLVAVRTDGTSQQFTVSN